MGGTWLHGGHGTAATRGRLRLDRLPELVMHRAGAGAQQADTAFRVVRGAGADEGHRSCSEVPEKRLRFGGALRTALARRSDRRCGPPGRVVRMRPFGPPPLDAFGALTIGGVTRREGACDVRRQSGEFRLVTKRVHGLSLGGAAPARGAALRDIYRPEQGNLEALEAPHGRSGPTKRLMPVAVAARATASRRVGGRRFESSLTSQVA